MPDEKDKNANPSKNNPKRSKKPAKFIVNPFAKLTDEDLQRAAIAGQRHAEAQIENERAGIHRAYERTLVWISRNGDVQRLPGARESDYESPRIAPDGRQVAVYSGGQIWLYDLARETLTRFTVEGKENNRPVWTPDGKRIAFCTGIEGSRNIFWQMADGSGGVERLTTGEHDNIPISFSPDGETLAFQESSMTGERRAWILRIWILRLKDRKAQPFLTTQVNQGTPQFSPDGRWLAYVSRESGAGQQVFVQPYPVPGDKVQVSTYGGSEPAWNPNGRELFFRSGANEQEMTAVDVAAQPTFTAGHQGCSLRVNTSPPPIRCPITTSLATANAS